VLSSGCKQQKTLLPKFLT